MRPLFLLLACLLGAFPAAARAERLTEARMAALATPPYKLGEKLDDKAPHTDMTA